MFYILMCNLSIKKVYACLRSKKSLSKPKLLFFWSFIIFALKFICDKF